MVNISYSKSVPHYELVQFSSDGSLISYQF